MKNIRIVLCDSDPADLEYYESLCKNYARINNISAEYKSYKFGQTLLFDLNNALFCKKLDVIFLALCKENTKEVLVSIRKIGYAGLVVLIGTEQDSISHEELFDCKTFNVIKSKTETQRFYDVFNKVVDAIAKSRDERLALTYGGDLRYITLSDILYFERKERGVAVYYSDRESFFFISTIAKLEQQLKGRRFCRASLSSLISLDAIEKITKNNRDYIAVMRDGTQVSIGRQYYALIKNEIKEDAI